jgi:hypothetical protein
MHYSLQLPEEEQVAVLDIPSGHIFPSSRPSGNMLPLLKGEAAALIQIWKALD